MSWLWCIFSLFFTVYFSVLKGKLVTTQNANSSPFSASRQVYLSQSTLDCEMFVKNFLFFKLIYYTYSIYKVYKDKLQNCSCNQFHYIGTYKQVETNSVTKNRGGNSGSEKWIEKHCGYNLLLLFAVRPRNTSSLKHCKHVGSAGVSSNRHH